MGDDMRNEMRGLELCGVAVVVLLAGCDHPTAIPPIPTPPARPTMTIADAAHGVGHPHFYFLPPLVPNPSFSGTFDPTLGPLLAVDVCRVDAGACVTPLIASFTSSGGATSASVRLDAAAEWYSVNWNTKAAALDPSQTYRIRVSVAGLTIGYADVDVVESGSELKNVQTGEFVGLLDGRTLPIKFRIERDPAIIAHVLHSQNYTAGQVAIVLQRDYRRISLDAKLDRERARSGDHRARAPQSELHGRTGSDCLATRFRARRPSIGNDPIRRILRWRGRRPSLEGRLQCRLRRRCADPQNCRLRCRRSGRGVTERLPTHFGAGGRVAQVCGVHRERGDRRAEHRVPRACYRPRANPQERGLSRRRSRARPAHGASADPPRRRADSQGCRLRRDSDRPQI